MTDNVAICYQLSMTLEEYRATTGTKDHDLACAVGCSREHITLVRNGDRKPSADLAVKLIAATGGKVTFEDIMVPSQNKADAAQ